MSTIWLLKQYLVYILINNEKDSKIDLITEKLLYLSSRVNRSSVKKLLTRNDPRISPYAQPV